MQTSDIFPILGYVFPEDIVLIYRKHFTRKDLNFGQFFLACVSQEIQNY